MLPASIRYTRSQRRVLLRALALTLISVAAPAAASARVQLLLPGATAFAVLGHSCGGIHEQVVATGLDAQSGYPVGAAYLQTRCGTGGRGGRTVTYSAWVSATWDFAGTLASYAPLATAPAVDPTLTVRGAYEDKVYNVLSTVNVTSDACAVTNTTYCFYRAYFTARRPLAPTGLAAVQIGDRFRVTWTPDPATAPVILASRITATPVGSTAPVLVRTLHGGGASALVGWLEPETTYAITVVNRDAGGVGATSTPITVTTAPSTVPPGAPALGASWLGALLEASWQPGSRGDSPIDAFEVSASPHDADPPVPSPVTESVSGSTLTAELSVADTFDWAVRVRAHNAAGWGPWSAAVVVPASA